MFKYESGEENNSKEADYKGQSKDGNERSRGRDKLP